jgi:hypothetical protein
VFWITLFANQRGFTARETVNALFLQVVSATTDGAHQWLDDNHKACSEIWHKVHDAMLNVFAHRIYDICDAWCNSPAGEYYNSLVEKARYFQKQFKWKLITNSSSKKTNPELTSEQIFKGFVDGDGKEYSPIPIDDRNSVFYVFEEFVAACDHIQAEEVRPNVVPLC